MPSSIHIGPDVLEKTLYEMYKERKKDGGKDSGNLRSPLELSAQVS